MTEHRGPIVSGVDIFVSRIRHRVRFRAGRLGDGLGKYNLCNQINRARCEAIFTGDGNVNNAGDGVLNA